MVGTTQCISCRAVLREGSRFCEECGAPLGADTQPAIARHATGSTNATRLLAAAALSRPAVSTWIRDWMSERNRSTPPEIGVDLDLVARVATFGERRARRYTYALFALALVVLVALLLSWPVIVLGAVAVAVVLVFVKRTNEREWLLGHFQRNHFAKNDVERRFTAVLTGAQKSAVPSPDTNLTVYSGFSPFVGAGLEMGAWSFAIATDKAKDDFGSTPPAQVSVAELYEAVAMRLQKLHLPGLEQRDHFFVHGQDVHEHPSLLPNKYGRPVSVLPPELVGRCSFGSDAHVRHYRWIHVADWAGDITVSCFLRCYKRGPTLFVEFKRFLLTPLQQTIRSIDDLAPLPLTGMAGEALLAILASPFRMLLAVFEVLRYVNEWWDDVWNITGRRRRKAIDRTARWDYGAGTSVRQAYASGEYVRYFQRADTDSYEKTLEKEILDALVDFLDGMGVNTADLRERQSTILNHGVIVQNGNIKAGSLAVGEGAQSMQRRFTNVVKKVSRTQGTQGAA
jgi:hypothetical protein